jgi:hypothetical protein
LASVSYHRIHTFLLSNKTSARSTSAAPTYFKPYYHERTRKTYVDGAIRRNNPIRVADEERKLIWPNESGRPDIILSLGTGIHCSQFRLPSSLVPRKKALVEELIPNGPRKNILALFDMVRSTMNCEREWDDFVFAHRSDPQFVGICHRLNVGLESKPPKLDDISEIAALERDALAYLGRRSSSLPYTNHKYRSAHDHIKVIADRLIATLFYFDDDDAGRDEDPPTISGTLRCRLNPSLTREFASLLHSRPEFRVKDSGGPRDFIHKPHFGTSTFSSPVKFLENVGMGGYWIEIRIKSRQLDWQPISGF